MFTGIIEELGKIIAIYTRDHTLLLRVHAPALCPDLKVGDSVSVNGCCLTVTTCDCSEFSCEIVPETLRCTTLGSLQSGEHVNLEGALRYNERLGGHLVQGHVDGCGTLVEKSQQQDGSWWVTFEIPPSLSRYLMPKGSIAVDGVSLTVATVQDTGCSCALIPHTARVTTLGQRQVGDQVNIEIDLLSKHIIHWVQ